MVDGEEKLDPEQRTSIAIFVGSIQNGETETIRLFELADPYIIFKNMTGQNISKNKEFIYEILLTGDNFSAKSFVYKINALDGSFRKMK